MSSRKMNSVSLGDYEIYDTRKGQYTAIVKEVSISAVRPEYYPETEPSKKITFTYKANSDWSIDAAGAKIYEALKASALPNIDVQIYFLVEYFKIKEYKAQESFTVGAFSVQQGERIPPDLFIDFVIEDSPDTLEGGSPVPYNRYEGIAAWILIQARIGKTLSDMTRRDYLSGLLKTLRQISSIPPFNIPERDADTFPSSPESFIGSSDSPRICFLAALYDYYAIASDDVSNITLRFCTLTTRFHDHLTLTLLTTLLATRNLPSDLFIRSFITPGLAEDALRILKPGQGVGKPYSLTPYSRSMNLIPKSMYSLTENPFFTTYTSVLIACAGTPSQTLITQPGVAVDVEVTVALKIHKYMFGLHPVGQFVRPTGSKETTEIERHYRETSGKSVGEIIGRIIKEVREQEGRPTHEELNMVLRKIEKNPVRPGSLCEYIKTMEPYNPPQIQKPLRETEYTGKSKQQETIDSKRIDFLAQLQDTSPSTNDYNLDDTLSTIDPKEV